VPADAVAELSAFIDASPSPFHAVATATALLDEAGLDYVVRDGALVAWGDVSADVPLRIIGAHTDSPNLGIKPRPDTGRAGARQLAVEPYGGVLLNSWLGRDLGISGRVALRDGSLPLVRVDRPVLHLPQLAIHLDRDIVTAGLKVDPQAHTAPLWGIGGPDEGSFRRFLACELGCDAGDVVAWDVMTHDLAPAAVVGRDGELLASARLDDLCCSWAALSAIIETGRGVVVLFDHEEVGSESHRGAGSPLLGDVLARLLPDPAARAAAIAGGVCASADMAHATHPNYAERHEPNHWIALGGGPVIKTNVNQRYATDARTAAVFANACDAAGVPVQWYAHRADLPCGSTIGPITAARLGMPVVDIGAPQLAMHSARELMAAADVGMLRDALAAFLRAG
jgi:aspartyl aminopeptidase